MYVSIDRSIHLSIYQSMDLSIHLSINRSIYRSFDRSIYLSIHLSINRSIYRSIDRSIDLSIHLSIYPSIYLSICPSIYLSIDLSVYGSISVPILSIYISSHLLFYITDLHISVAVLCIHLFVLVSMYQWNHVLLNYMTLVPSGCAFGAVYVLFVNGTTRFLWFLNKLQLA